ncbi:unnamed protein product [Medioppia subpectinata]|uniref:Neurotransmitter-gated ion-channel ligand-binding domain-containing protein n=1 Tax=Medioppia subpectinata TaxID=1979941 RepID=A0A7R9Q4H6_9ACAR|nr:unnamed protein product [Medioppia subpectinata]CAG2112646.1 unnamed protein product [Medioppia subpectinata]
MNSSIVSIVVFAVCVSQILCNPVAVSLNPKVAALKAFKAKTSPELYDKDVRPNLGEMPVKINVSMYVIDYNLDSPNREMMVNIYFRQLWNDPRLANEGITESAVGGKSLVDRVWIPDTFFANSMEVLANKYPTRNSFLRVEPNGNVFYSERIRVLFRCDARMSTKTDECDLEMESYGLGMTDIEYGWKNGETSVKFDQRGNNHNKYKMTQSLGKEEIKLLPTYVFDKHNYFILKELVILCNPVAVSLNPKVAALKAFKVKTSPELYDKDVRPNLGEMPVKVNVSMYVIDYTLDSPNREMNVNIYFRQLWNDPRLANEDITESAVGGKSLVDRVWIPDTFFANSMEVLANKYPTRNSFLMVKPNGDVFYSERIRVLFRCGARMATKTDECDLEMESCMSSELDIC